MIDLRVVDEPGELGARAAELIEDRALSAMRERGAFTVAVSGGSTPTAMFDALAERSLPWTAVHLFQVDERLAPLGDPDRNLADLAGHLLERSPIPWRNVHLMPVDAEDPDAAAAAYAAMLQDVAGGVLDLVHLGLGDDGHTASWPPGDADVDTWDGDVAVTQPFNGRRRMTLTPPTVNRARLVLWLVEGAAKAPMVTRLLEGGGGIPAGRVTVDHQVLFADRAALPA